MQKRLEQILDETRVPASFGRRGWAALLLGSLPVAYLALAVELAPAQTRTPISVAEPLRAPDPVPQPAKHPTQIIAQTRRDTGQPLSPQATPAPRLVSLEGPYQKWLDEDVVYIISVEERRAFLQLATDDERQQFIAQFWLRRDPTPGTEANEMKEEHYRRLAFVNDRFAEKIPGWKTDRGVVYIKYGPPDALDSHGATPATYPYETWHYRFIEGMGENVDLEFVDLNMTGRFHLVKDPTEKNRK